MKESIPKDPGFPEESIYPILDIPKNLWRALPISQIPWGLGEEFHPLLIPGQEKDGKLWEFCSRSAPHS